MGRTDLPPAVACSDSGWNKWENNYNCIIAWTDKGISRSGPSEVAILYHFFRVDQNGNIDLSGDTLIRGASTTSASPALAFFADEMWIAWKQLSGPVIQVYRSTTAGTWNHSIGIAATDAVGSPSWGARDGSESAVIWARSQ